MNKKSSARIPALGLRENVPQFVLLVAVNALVGGMVGQQQTVLPLLAGAEFGLSGYTFIFSYVAAFGIAKTVSNWFAGTLADRHGRKPVLLFGWLFAVPVPLMLILAPSWGWIVAANILLGINQGLTWSTTVVMKIDLVGPSQRGLAMGFNESAGYGAVAITSLLAGYLAEQFGLRPAPFLLGVAYTALGLVLTGVFVRETKGHAQLEAEQQRTTHPVGATGVNAQLASRGIAALGSFRDPSLSSASWAGLVNNLNFGLSWGVFPLLFASASLSDGRIGPLFAIYPGVWGLGQLATGALSDRVGRKHLVVWGMTIQGVALGVIAAGHGFGIWAAGAALLGIGTAMVYPTLLAVVGDVAHPAWRGRAVGVYRVWRDVGYAVGALAGGLVADALGLAAAVVMAAVLSVLMAIVVAARMRETHHSRPV